MMRKDPWHHRFSIQRSCAKARGIPFLLTFGEWCALWRNSGHWHQRGPCDGQYVMARYGDKGAYEWSNVRVCLADENRAECNQNYPRVGELNAAYGKNYWLGLTPEARMARSAKISKATKGKSKPACMHASLSATATGRRRVIRDGRMTWAYRGDVDYPGGTF